MNVNLPVARLTRPEAKARTRAALLAAGEQVFATVGFHTATVEGIAATAGFTRGAFYANFRDKADLLLTLVEERSQADLARLQGLLGTGPPDHGLGALVEWFALTFAPASPLDLAMAEFSPLASRNPSHLARIRARLRDVHHRVTSMIEAECARADFRLSIPPERFATMVIAVVDGLAALYRLDADLVPAELLAETITYLGQGLAAR